MVKQLSGSTVKDNPKIKKVCKKKKKSLIYCIFFKNRTSFIYLFIHCILKARFEVIDPFRKSRADYSKVGTILQWRNNWHRVTCKSFHKIANVGAWPTLGADESIIQRRKCNVTALIPFSWRRGLSSAPTKRIKCTVCRDGFSLPSCRDSTPANRGQSFERGLLHQEAGKAPSAKLY